MGDFTVTAAAFRQRLVDSFTALPLFWPNDERQLSATDAAVLQGWVTSEFRVTSEGPVTLGPTGQRTHRDRGEFAVYVYVPRSTRAGTAEGYAQTIRNLFKIGDLVASGVVIQQRIIGAGQVVDGPNGSWWAVPIIITWWADRIE